MQEPQGFCKAVMHEYERQWSRAGGHAVRHPLRLKMEQLKSWCADACSVEQFDARLQAAQSSEDIGESLLAEELLPLWRTVCTGGRLPFGRD